VQVLVPAGSSDTIDSYVVNQTPSHLVEMIEGTLNARGALGQSEQLKEARRQTLERTTYIFASFDLPERMSNQPQRFIHDTRMFISIFQARSGSNCRAEEDHITHDHILKMRAVQQS
jgi:hypothetical protein